MLNKHAKEHGFKVCNEILETVIDYVYLGQVLSAYPSHEKEITGRTNMGLAAFRRNSGILNSTFCHSKGWYI